MLKALPLPCFFSQRARSFLPSGQWRTKSTAASEKAHFRCTFPILAARPVLLARRFLGAAHQPGIGGKLLHPIEATDVVDLVENRHRQHLADARDRAQQLEALWLVLLGLGDHGEVV